MAAVGANNWSRNLQSNHRQARQPCASQPELPTRDWLHFVPIASLPHAVRCRCADVERAFARWQANQQDIVGFFPRLKTPGPPSQVCIDMRRSAHVALNAWRLLCCFLVQCTDAGCTTALPSLVRPLTCPAAECSDAVPGGAARVSATCGTAPCSPALPLSRTNCWTCTEWTDTRKVCSWVVLGRGGAATACAVVTVVPAAGHQFSEQSGHLLEWKRPRECAQARQPTCLPAWLRHCPWLCVPLQLLSCTQRTSPAPATCLPCPALPQPCGAGSCSCSASGMETSCGHSRCSGTGRVRWVASCCAPAAGYPPAACTSGRECLD